MSEPAKICPKCQTVAPLAAGLCRGCDHKFRTQFTPTAFASAEKTQAVVPAIRSDNLAPVRSQPLLSADYLSCRVCGNASVERVATLCQSGSWTSRTSAASIGAAYARGVGVIPAVSGSVSVTAGASTLVQMLMPPPRPFSYPANRAQLLFGYALSFLGFVVFCGFSTGAIITGLVFAGVGGFLIWNAYRFAAHSRRQAEAALPRWEEAMTAWNRLFYCSRCGHAFDPETGSYQLPEHIGHLFW